MKRSREGEAPTKSKDVTAAMPSQPKQSKPPSHQPGAPILKSSMKGGGAAASAAAAAPSTSGASGAPSTSTTSKGASAYSDLDDLFSGITKKKAAKVAASAAEVERAKAGEEWAKAEAVALRARMDALERAGRAANGIKGDESPKPLRFDAALGVKVYSTAALKIGQGEGDTDLCPIDCSCCF